MASKPVPSELKALLLTREYPPEVYGGAGVHVEYLARELARRIPVEVRTFGEQTLRMGDLVVQGFGRAATPAPEAPERFEGALRALQVDLSMAAEPSDASLVHCHTWYAHFAGLLVHILAGIPLVVTAHSLEPLRPWKREQLGAGYNLSAWIEKSALEAADAVIAVSREMERDILRYFAIPAERIRVIHNGIDTEEYHRVESRDRLEGYGIDPSRPYVLFVGRTARQKGILHLVNAIPFLDSRAQVVLCAGAPDTPEIAREMAERVARVQASRDGVIWIQEMVEKPTVIQLYSHAAVFCCPSIYEPFGIINLEAMACSIPIVATAIGGIPEVVVDGETGILVPLAQEPHAPFEPRDPERFSRDLATAVNRLLGDESRRRAMGEVGRKRAVSRFSWAAIAEQTLALYREVIGKRPGRVPGPEARPRRS
jgi:starch synthase